MSGASRKMKNPLLSAAGQGFPYEDYTENALLVPVTPATPAVLRDDVELDNFIGQEPANIQAQIPTKTHDSPTNVSSQPAESKDAANQSARPGYFTSILSSLPNLSLSSAKLDFPGSQISQAPENINVTTHEPNPYASSQGHHGSQPEVPGFLAINPQESRSTDLSGFAAFAPPSSTANLPQPIAPPSLPQSGYAPVSYRLGNQRRLKYAPPPDLTSNNAKPYSSPSTFFPAQSISAPSTILNPYVSEGSLQGSTPSSNLGAQQISSSTEQLPSSEQLSRNSSLHSSFRSSPVPTGTAYNSSVTSANQNQFTETSSISAPPQFASSSRPIPARVLEPATPQNTPANVSFPGFVPYVNRDLPASNWDKDVAVFKNPSQLNLSSEFPKNSFVVEPTAESASKPSLISGQIDTSFTPISAAKVTEKLEHLLAEQQEDSLCEAAPEVSSEVDKNTTGVAAESARSTQFETQTLQTSDEPIDRSCDIKSNDNQEKAISSESKSNTWSDVFLGQEPTTQSAICPEVHTADNNPVVTDIQAVKPNAHPPQQSQLYQAQPISIPSSTFCTNKSADQKSNLNYVSPFPQQSLQQQGSFYNPPNPTEQSANVFLESTKPDRFRHLQSHEGNANAPFGHPITEGIKSHESNANASFGHPITEALNNSQQFRETSAFSSAGINPATNIPDLWSADQSSQQQVLNTTFDQSVYTVTSQSTSQAPAFYNPTQFAKELPKQSIFPHTYDQHSVQQQPYQNPHFYGNTSGLQPAVSMVTTVPEPTGSATLSPVQMSVNSPTNRTTPDTVPPSFQSWASGSSDKRMQYRTVYHHWFYRKEVENKTLWLPFSMRDSLKLEEAHNSSDITPETTVATDGGRYDVDILRRERTPVYWTGDSTEVRRCSWFYKGTTDSRYVPYNETTAVKLEEEYKQACLSNNWNRRIELSNGEYIAFHSATVQVHNLPPSPELAGSWGNNAGSEDSTYLQGAASRPRVVKRGVDEFNIDEGEPEKVDHLLFLVHGIGSVCDLKFRTVEEVVDEFRSISYQLVQSHYRTASEHGIVNRIEVLPISWHTTLHSDETGIDKKLQAITLESIPKLRHFTNDTLLDILFYTSPTYCQTIMQTVGSEMNRLHALFKERNPSFDGGIYLGGHSLGSLIMFDLLCHQKPSVEEEAEDDEENDIVEPIKPMPAPVLRRRLSKRISYVMGIAGTGQPFIHYPQLNFHPRAFFALGSPIGMFVTVRGIDTLGENFTLPTCPAFFNIFHPFDPVAYRVESLINSEAHKFRPMLIPHHKGRKRMHLELKETMARVGADLKQKLIDSVRHTWNSFYQLALFHKPDNQTLEREIDKVVEEQMQNPPNVPDQQNNDDAGADVKIGRLNGGRRVDYVLQEAPFEYINEYIFAITSHICYWESEDTMLLILKEMYGSMGIQTDAQLPQQTLSIERLSPSPSVNLASALSPSSSNAGTASPVMGVDPTVPISGKPVGPPPKAGFVPKS